MTAMGALAKVGSITNKGAEFLFDQKPMSHRFMVNLDRSDWDLGTWSKVSGLSVRWSKIAYRVGEDNEERVLAGNVTLENLKLSRAACADSNTVKRWLVETARNGQPFPGAVHLLDFVGMPVVSWEFRNLFPVGWSIGEMDSTAGKPMIETLELAHSGFLDYDGKVSG